MRWVGLAAACLVLGLSGQADASLLINISKSQQQVTVSVDGAAAYRWPVSTGRAGWDTPSGSFHAIRLERVYYSKKFDDAPMPNSVFFYGGYAMHGTFEESKLGRPASHGCVRLHRANAAVLFELVRQHGMQNTRVVVSDGPAMSAPLQAYAPATRLRATETYNEPPRKKSIEERAARPPQKPQRLSSSRSFEALFRDRDEPRTHSRRHDEVRYGTREHDESRLRRIYRDAGFRW